MSTTTTTTINPNLSLQSLVRVPEFIIQDAIVKALVFLKADYEAAVTNTDETKSMLYKLVGTIGFEKYQYFTEAKAVFITADATSPRQLQVHLMFNMQRSGIPTIHITSPGESTGQNALGNDQGYLDNWVNLDDEDPAVIQNTNSVFTRRYNATYDIVVTSDNSNEVVLIYHILKALFASLIFHFNANGLQNVALSGQDLNPYKEIVPLNIFVRALRMSLQYETSTTSFETQNIPSSIIFTPQIINPLE